MILDAAAKHLWHWRDDRQIRGLGLQSFVVLEAMRPCTLPQYSRIRRHAARHMGRRVTDRDLNVLQQQMVCLVEEPKHEGLKRLSVSE